MCALDVRNERVLQRSLAGVNEFAYDVIRRFKEKVKVGSYDARRRGHRGGGARADDRGVRCVAEETEGVGDERERKERTRIYIISGMWVTGLTGQSAGPVHMLGTGLTSGGDWSDRSELS
jgi:hypothetical protein